jgi:hypothetical protein
MNGWARSDARTIHLLAETMKIGFYNRAKYLGDTDFVDVDLGTPTSKEFALGFRDGIALDSAMPSLELGANIVTRGEGTETTHFSVVDSDGNMVANTHTIEQGYGSRVIAKGTGVLLNNETHDFNMTPRVTDTSGMSRYRAQPDCTRETDAEFDVTHADSARQPARAGHGQSRRTHDHQHGLSGHRQRRGFRNGCTAGRRRTANPPSMDAPSHQHGRGSRFTRRCARRFEPPDANSASSGRRSHNPHQRRPFLSRY